MRQYYFGSIFYVFQFHFFASIKSRQCQSCFNYSNIGAMPVNTKFYS